MDPVNLLGILLGLGVLALIALAVFRGELHNLEKPKYEMLGQAPPAESQPAQPGRLGIEDRIIRLGICGAAGYYASHLGWQTPLGLLLILISLYTGATGLIARDYVYKFLKLDTRLPEHRK
jgi:hypothetical protein